MVRSNLLPNRSKLATQIRIRCRTTPPSSHRARKVRSECGARWVRWTDLKPKPSNNLPRNFFRVAERFAEQRSVNLTVPARLACPAGWLSITPEEKRFRVKPQTRSLVTDRRLVGRSFLAWLWSRLGNHRSWRNPRRRPQ